MNVCIHKRGNGFLVLIPEGWDTNKYRIRFSLRLERVKNRKKRKGQIKTIIMDDTNTPSPEDVLLKEATFRAKIRDYLQNTSEGQDLIDRILESAATSIVNEAKVNNLSDDSLAKRMETEIKRNVMSSDVFERRLWDYSNAHLTGESDSTYAYLVKTRVQDTVKTIAPYGICYMVVDTLNGLPPHEFNCSPPVSYGALRFVRVATKEDLEANATPGTVVLYTRSEANISTSTPSDIEYKYLTVNVKNNTTSNLTIYCKAVMRATPVIKNMVYSKNTPEVVEANGGVYDYKIAVPVPSNTSEQAKADAVVSVFVS